MLPPVEMQREALRTATFEAPHRYRVLFVGRFTQGSTDVVASLKRALEALGHRVFHVDTDRHLRILDTSSGVAGGYGPIYLDVSALRPMLDRFRPQVVVTCAGGIVVTANAASEVRDRGAVLVGITLSDPDVQPSIIDHVARFDYHTTNSALALQRYEQAGITNTFLLPFGIDRDYVLRRVSSDPSLRADVICLGHAVGRGDRHAVMVALARRFHVRVYGTGWPIAGSAPVAGDRLLQAAREGTFHVNFPATRAGFTNVKCGVFESVGAGAVVCTAEFDEMARLFEYGTEIVGYRSADDLGDTIAALLADPEAFERIRRRAFRRLVTEHLYEHRWLSLFRQIVADTEAERPTVGTERAAEIREILASGNKPARTVLVSGYFGARNRGDDLLLEAVTRGIEAHVPDAHVVVAAADAGAVETHHGLPAFDRLDPVTSETWAARASAIVLGPGGLWHDYAIQRAGGVAGIVTGATTSPAHLVQLPAMTVAHGGTFHVFGMGVGPLRDDAARATVRLAGRLADSVVVRDTASRELLEGIDGWPGAVEQAPDIAYALRLPNVQRLGTGGGGHLAVNVRPWRFEDVGIDRIRDALATVAAAHTLDIVGVSMQPSDEPVLNELLAGLDIPGRASVLPADTPFDSVVNTLSTAVAVLSMRLHTNLIAHRLGRPAVGLAYDPKITEHFAELGRQAYALPLSVSTEELTKVLESTIEEERLTADAGRTVADLEHRAAKAVERLCARLCAAPVRVPAAGIIPPALSKPSVLLPTGWASTDLVDLTAGTFVSGNAGDAKRDVPVAQWLQPSRGLRFSLADRAPRRGDYVTWRLDLPTRPGEALRVELLLEQRYKERPNRRGRIAYEVLVDGRRLFRQDVAVWKPRNTVWIARTAVGDHVRVEVRIVALRDCEAWNWGPAAATRIEAVRRLPWAGGESLIWGASSPMAGTNLRVPASESTSPRRTSAIVRRIRRLARRTVGR
jgi:polysaccharide pyruvyl transferase WcaK-like protein